MVSPYGFINLMSGVSSTRTAEDADKDGQPVPCMNDAKSLTQVFLSGIVY
jgi:hypothetical protein